LFVVLMLVMTAFAIVPVNVGADGETIIIVSQPKQVTSSDHYERGESIAYDGTYYWLFYGCSDSVTGNYGNDNPDTHDYKVYYKKATAIDGLTTAIATLVSGTHNTDIYLGETDAAYFDGKVWVFASSDVGSGCALYSWNTTDGSSWDEWNLSSAMGISLLPDGAAHFAAAVCDGKLWVAYQLGNDWNAKYWDGNSWSSEYDIATGYGTAKFYVEETEIYFVRAAGGIYLYKYNSVSETWEEIDSVTEPGAYDPTIYNIGGSYVCAYAPWVSPKQWIKAKVGTSLDTILSTGVDVEITSGIYGSNAWVDMWPYAFTDVNGDTYLFFTSERNPADPSSEITGNIWYLEVDWDVTKDHFDYIQPAIDAATGTTIYVYPGVYTESVTIMKSIDLVGIGDPTIKCPSSPEDIKIAESSKYYEYVVLIAGGTYNSGNDTIYGSNVVNVEFNGFIIDSNNYIPSRDRFAAILCRNVQGDILYNDIKNTNYDGKETFGILCYGDMNIITIEENTIDKFGRGGIGVNGGSCEIIDNTVIGPGLGVPVTWAPNGIQVGYGTTGSVVGNDVSGCGWPGTDWCGTGILVVDTSGVTVKENYVHDCEQAIGTVDFPSAYGPPWDLRALSDIVINYNILEDNEWGIQIANKADNIIICGNKILNTNGDAIDVYSYSNAQSDEVPTNIKIHYNIIVGSGADGLWIGDTVTDTVNATYNWWGDSSGPYDDTGSTDCSYDPNTGLWTCGDLNADGSGDNVTGNAKYCPWLVFDPNDGLTNMGFETGDLFGWFTDTASEFVGVVGVDTFYVHDDPSQPYTVHPGEGSFMLRLGKTTPWDTQPTGNNSVYQVFVATEPFVRFAYNIFTYDWQGYNFFKYKLSFACNDTVIYSYDQTAWGTWGDTSLKTTGWRSVCLDVSRYIGKTLKLWISGGGSSDNYYRTWVYIDSGFGNQAYSWDGSQYVTQDVTTHVNVAGGTDDPSNHAPVIKAKWEYDLDHGEDAAPDTGLQVAPTLHGSVKVGFYAVVTDDEGVNTVQAVYADVWHPDGQFKYQIELTPIGFDDYGYYNKVSVLSIWDHVVAEHYDIIKFNGYSEDDIREELDQELAYIYYGEAYISYCQPGGYYTVGVRAHDNFGAWSDYLYNTFWYIPTAAVEIDFTDVYYGNAVICEDKWIGGDKDMSTSDKPTVRNIGNTPVYLTVWQDDMGFSKTDGEWNVMFDARLGAPSDSNTGTGPYQPEVETTIPGTLGLCTEEKLDFSIHVIKGFPGETYTGTMILTAYIDGSPYWITPDGFVGDAPNGVAQNLR